MPALARDLLARTSTIVETTDHRVSPKTGLGNLTSVMPRFATVVPKLSVTPITSPSVKMELISGLQIQCRRNQSASIWIRAGL